MLLRKNRRLFTVAGDNSHVLTPIPMHLIPIPFPSHGLSYTHSHGNPMGPMGSQSFPFPCTPLIRTPSVIQSIIVCSNPVINNRLGPFRHLAVIQQRYTCLQRDTHNLSIAITEPLPQPAKNHQNVLVVTTVLQQGFLA